MRKQKRNALQESWLKGKFSRYLVGLDGFKLFTEHKPLLPVTKSQDIERTPVRYMYQRLLMRLGRFNIVVEFVPGKQLVVPDKLPRSPLKCILDTCTNRSTAEGVTMCVDFITE